VGYFHGKIAWSPVFKGGFNDGGAVEPAGFQGAPQRGVIDIARLQILGPDPAERLAQVEGYDPAAIHFQDVLHGNLAIAASAVNPVGIETEIHAGGIDGAHHVCEFPRAAAHFRVVGVVGQHLPLGSEPGPEFLQQPRLEPELGVGFVLESSPCDGIRVADVDNVETKGILGRR